MADNSNPAWQSAARASSDLATLRESLAFAERRAAILAELTALMSEGRDPLALAQRSVELTARTTRAAGAFVYLWDRDTQRLVLQVATEGWQRTHLGRIQLRMGEGITGWSALMRQTVVIPKDHLKDPRSRPFPELRESSFKSMIAVPVVTPGEEILGVFSLYAPAEDAFTSTDVNLATEVGSLLASGLIQAETVSQLRIQSAAARFLRDLPDEAWGSLQGCLHIMASQCALHLEADICMIELATDRAHPHEGTTVIVATQRFRDEHNVHIPDDTLDRSSLAQLLAPLSMQRLRIPLAAAAPIGAVTCYRPRQFTAEDELLLEAIGAQAAAGVLSLPGTERVRPAMYQLLSAPDQATTEQLLRRYGWQPQPAWPTVLRIHRTASGEPRDLDDDRVRTAVLDLFGAESRNFLLLGGQGQFLALAQGTDPASREPFIRRISDLGRQTRMRLTAGIGPVATAPGKTHTAIRHALVASQWAELAASDRGAIVRYEDVAHLRLLPSAALDMSANLKGLLYALGAVVRYDLDNGTDLAQTLDTLLANSGSAAKTSSQLFIHRNTLRQRIQRVEELIGRSPEHFEDWVIAGIAARLIRKSESDLDPQLNPHGGSPCPHGVLTIGRSCCGLPCSCSLLPDDSAPQSHRKATT
jgi:GAF domain-containing protein